MEKYLTEVIGTFFLVLTIGTTVVAGTDLAPIAIGAALMVMVYMGGHVSGAHYNPAVSVAVLMRGAMEKRDFLPYIIAQCLGALLAAATVRALTGSTFAPAPGPDISIVSALLAEFLFTFALALVVLQVATAPQTQGNSYYGLAIGFTVGAGAFAVGPISGGAFNPAVGFGPIVMHTIATGAGLADLWLYIVGPVAGGALAALVYRFQMRGVVATP